nr:hypothetical protein Iba_chr13bCG0300 [Ipomoea batatas]
MPLKCSSSTRWSICCWKMEFSFKWKGIYRHETRTDYNNKQVENTKIGHGRERWR